jgi:hypothetical protein
LLPLFQFSNKDNTFVTSASAPSNDALAGRDNKNLSQQVIGETKKAPLSRYDIINNIFMNERMAEALS